MGELLPLNCIMITQVQNQPKHAQLTTPREMLTYVSPEDGRLRRTLIRFVENLSGRKRLRPLYEEIVGRDISGHALWETSLEVLDIRACFDAEKLEAIPRTGPLVFIANHPFGVVDGLILGSLAARVRSQFHFLVHEALIHQDPRLQSFLLPVDFKDNKQALATNLATRRASVDRLGRGEALVIFPGGGVATAKIGFGKVQEFEWKRFVASVIQKSKATVVPVYFHGKNSRAFHLISQFSDTLRLGFLLHEIKNMLGKEVFAEIGNPIPYSDLEAFKHRQDLLDHLYRTTMNLGGTKNTAAFHAKDFALSPD